MFLQKEQSLFHVFQQIPGQFLSVQNIGFAGPFEQCADHADMEQPFRGFFGKKKDPGLVEMELPVFVVSGAKVKKQIRRIRFGRDVRQFQEMIQAVFIERFLPIQIQPELLIKANLPFRLNKRGDIGGTHFL